MYLVRVDEFLQVAHEFRRQVGRRRYEAGFVDIARPSPDEILIAFELSRNDFRPAIPLHPVQEDGVNLFDEPGRDRQLVQ